MPICSVLPFKLQRAGASAIVAGAAMPTACGSIMYLDTATREVPVAELRKPAQAKPVALSFEFRTNGALNARATDFFKDRILAQLRESGLFSEVQPGVSPDTAMLSISLNNAPISKAAAAQGFVTDGYICQLSYLAPGKAAALTATARHAIQTTIGNASAPADAVEAAGPDEAVRTMTRQILSNALRDLSVNSAF